MNLSVSEYLHSDRHSVWFQS